MEGLGKLMAIAATVLLAELVAISCGNRAEVSVSRENMESILYEMLMLDELLYSRGDIRAQSDSSYAYLPIFEKYGCSIEDFNGAIDYYLRNIDDFIKLSSSVKERLETELALSDSAAVNMPEEKEKIADTLKNIPKGEKKRRKLDKEKMKKLEEKFK